MPKKTFTPIDLYFATNNRDTLAADLAPLALGLTRNDAAGEPTLVPTAHDPTGNGHALDYAGKLLKTPAIYDTADAGTSQATPPAQSPSILKRALNLLTGGGTAPAPTPTTPKLLTPATYHDREAANLRLYGPDATTRAGKIRAANFRSGTVLLPAPATPSRRWA